MRYYLILFLLLWGCGFGDITGRNFNGNPSPDVGEETVFVRCNFSHLQPDTIDPNHVVGVRLFPGDNTPKIFIRCNLVNCRVPPGSTVIDCNNSIVERNVKVGERTYTIDGVGVTIDVLGVKLWRDGNLIKTIGDNPPANITIDTTSPQYEQLVAALTLMSNKLKSNLAVMEWLPEDKQRAWLARDPLLKSLIKMCISVADQVKEMQGVAND